MVDKFELDQSTDVAMQPDAPGSQNTSNKKPDLWRKYKSLRVDNSDGSYSETFRTPFGEQVDHMDEFYEGLSPEQKALFVNPLRPYRMEGNNEPRVIMGDRLYQKDMNSFEASLNPRQLEQWKDLRATAARDGNYTPEEGGKIANSKLFANYNLISDAEMSDPKAFKKLIDTLPEYKPLDPATPRGPDDPTRPFPGESSAVLGGMSQLPNGLQDIVQNVMNVLQQYLGGQPLSALSAVGSLNGGVRMPFTSQPEALSNTPAPPVTAPAVNMSMNGPSPNL